MDLNFADVIAQLGPDFALRIINDPRQAGDYYFTRFLPEELRGTYDAKGGAMTIRSPMAGLVGMDSAYPPGGGVTGSAFNEQIAKVAQEVPLTEKIRRELRMLILAMGQAGSTNQILQENILRFADKVLAQAQFDTAEWMRGVALTTGKLEWEFGGITLDVDYGIKSGHLFPQRTTTAGYGGTVSVFWADWRAGLALLKGQLREAFAHPDTINLIISNSVNKITLTAQDFATGTAEFFQFVGDASTGPRNASSDARDRARIVGYGMEGEAIDPDDPDGDLIAVPFMPRGLIVMVGNPVNRGMRIGLGSANESENNPLRLGYTHLGPTEEQNGVPGRWSEVFIPQNQPYMVRGRTAANLLPVIEANDKYVVLSTTMTPA
jgi:hypothetical protein